MFKNIDFQDRKTQIWLSVLALPYLLLVLIQLINPFLQDAFYCPRPSVLEDTIWIFTSPVIHWTGYAITFLIIYILAFLVRRSFKAAKVHQGELPENAPSAFRVVAPSFFIFFGIFVLGVIAFLLGVSGNYYRSIVNILNLLNELLIPIFLLISIITFVFGAYQYFIPGLDGNRTARRNGRIRMFFSAMLVIPVIVIWVVINLIANSTGLSSEDYMNAPTLSAVPRSGEIADSVSKAGRDTIGFSVGGAKDADNFRENIEQCYLPVPTDITYEGLYYDYVFDTQNVV